MGYPFPSIAKVEDCELIERHYEAEPQSEEQTKALQAHGLTGYIDVRSACFHGIILRKERSMERLTHERVNGIKTGYWSAATKEALVQRLAAYENTGLDGFAAYLNHPSYKPEAVVIVASWGGGWEHVSVSLARRCPTWEEMCMIKDIFWGEEECVVEYHPPRSQYVNRHPYCLHLWKKIGEEFETPPKEYVG